MARKLSPLLFTHPTEYFALERVVAVVHPSRRVVAYHLLWRDDVHGSWIPFTVPTDQEVVWVGYDDSREPVEIWTYWHGSILHTAWANRGRVEIDVQWGKHGSLPRGVIESDLPWTRKLNGFYAFTWIGLPDMWLGNLTRGGPWCFCGSYARYRQYTQRVDLSDRLTTVVATDDPTQTLEAVFGKPFSRKPLWPR